MTLEAPAAIQAAGNVRFVVHGFDDEPWRATTRTDLSVVLVQLPDVLAKLRTGQTAELDFYEQGLERLVRFEGADEELEVTCESRHLSWDPRPARLRMKRSEVEKMLSDLGRTFVRLADQACPELAQHEWLRAWSAGI